MKMVQKVKKNATSRPVLVDHLCHLDKGIFLCSLIVPYIFSAQKMRKKKVSASPNRGSSKSPARSNRTTRTKRKASDNDQEEVGNFIFLFYVI